LLSLLAVRDRLREGPCPGRKPDRVRFGALCGGLWIWFTARGRSSARLSRLWWPIPV